MVPRSWLPRGALIAGDQDRDNHNSPDLLQEGASSPPRCLPSPGLSRELAARQRQRRQGALDVGTSRFEPRRQHQRSAQMGRILVNRETRTTGRDLEQHATRLLEVHGLEPEAIDHVSGAPAGGFDLGADRKFLVEIVYRPGQMMHGPDAPGASPFTRRLANVDHAGGVPETIAGPVPLAAEFLEAESAGQECRGRRLLALPDLRAVQ